MRRRVRDRLAGKPGALPTALKTPDGRGGGCCRTPNEKAEGVPLLYDRVTNLHTPTLRNWGCSNRGTTRKWDRWSTTGLSTWLNGRDEGSVVGRELGCIVGCVVRFVVGCVRSYARLLTG